MNKKYQSVRYFATGIFGYDFIDEHGQKIGGASTLVAPNQPICIDGFGYKFYSKVNENGYICIEDTEHRTIAYIQCLDQSRYSLHLYNLTLCIEVDALSYRFFVDELLVISMTRDEQRKLFHIEVFGEVDIASSLIAFSIPAILNT